MAIVYRVGLSELSNQQIDDNFRYVERLAETKTNGYEIVEADGNNTIMVNPSTGDFTISLDAAVDLVTPASFVVTVINIGSSNSVIIDPTGSETINGSATYTLSAQYDSVTLQCDGSNWLAVAATAASSDTFANDVVFSKDISVGETAYFDSLVTSSTSTTTHAIDWQSGNKQRLTLNHDITLSFTNDPEGPCGLHLRLQQDATGSRTVTWPASVLWPGGSAPTLSGASGVDIISLFWDDSNYYASFALDFS